MGVFGRSIRRITEKKSNSLLIVLISFILGTIFSGSLAIRSAVGQLKQEIRYSLVSKLSITLDKIYNANAPGNPSLSMADALAFGQDERVQRFEYTRYFEASISTADGTTTSYDQRVLGTSALIPEPFEQGDMRLVAGRLFTAEELDSNQHVVLLPMSAMTMYQLGDTVMIGQGMIIKPRSMDTPLPTIDSSQRLTVIGFYDEYNAAATTTKMAAIVPNIVLDEIYQGLVDQASAAYLGASDRLFYVYYSVNNFVNEFIYPLRPKQNAVYYELKNANDMDRFVKEVDTYLKANPKDHFTINTTNEAYQQVMAPIQSLGTIADYSLIFSSVLIVLVLSMVTLLLVRDRSTEFGILLAMGERRVKLVTQVVIEILILATFSLSAALFAGKLAAEQMSNQLIDLQVDMAKLQSDESEDSNNLSNLSLDEVRQLYAVNLSETYIAMFYGIGFLLIVSASIVPTVYIVRLNPKRILLD